jgi:SAM-dependent methyltransferase
MGLFSSFQVGAGSDVNLCRTFDILRKKWNEVPSGPIERIRSDDLLLLPDNQLLDQWNLLFRNSSVFSRRGWRHLLYRDVFEGKRIIDFGCGLAFDTVYYAEHGAQVTFIDIVRPNVEVVRRICRLKGLEGCDFCYMEDLTSLSSLQGGYDAIYCCGSLIHAPLNVIQAEAQSLLRHLPVGGRWLELAYPKVRWERDGGMPFHRWSEKTDGGAPWTEWHDLEKLRSYLHPAQFEVVLEFEYHGGDFNWFDLVRVS